MLESRAIMPPEWVLGVRDAIIEAAKAEVGIARIHYSAKEVMRQGTEQVDRVEIIVTVRAP